MRPHARLLAVLAAVAALLLAIVAVVPAQAAEDSSVRVTVTGPGGAPLEGAESVTAYLLPVPTSDYYYQAEAEPNAPLTFEDMWAGDFYVAVHPEGGRYLPKSTETFRLESGEVKELTVELEVGGLVEGTVRNPDGSAVRDLTLGSVVLQKLDDEGTWIGYASALVRPDGTYEVPVPEAGTYRIQYEALPPKLWARSEPMELTRDSVETVDVTVQEGGSVSGVVAIEGTPGTAPEAFIAAYELVDGAWTVFDSTPFDQETGRYDLYLAGPEDREIRLEFKDYTTSTYSFWDGTTYGAATVEDAATISVPGGGAVTGKDFTVRLNESIPAAIENTAPPAIYGTTTVGQTLTTTTGVWSVEFPQVALQWRRDGVDIAGATGETYVLTEQDRGAVITVAAVASKADHATSAEVTSEPVGPVVAAPALARSTIVPLALPGKGKVSFLVLVMADGVPLSKVSGRLDVLLDGTPVGTTAVRNGLAAVEVTGQARGTHRYTLAYSGNARVAAGEKVVRATIR